MELAMRYAAHKSELTSVVGNTPVTSRFHGQKPLGLLRHMLDAFAAWAAKGDEADLADLLERSGGRLTDSIEREMLQRRTHSNWTAFY